MITIERIESIELRGKGDPKILLQQFWNYLKNNGYACTESGSKGLGTDVLCHAGGFKYLPTQEVEQLTEAAKGG